MLLSLIVFFVLYFVNCLLFLGSLFTPLPTILLLFLLLGIRYIKLIKALSIFANVLILPLTLLNVNFGIKVSLLEITLLHLTNFVIVSTLFSLVHQLMLEFLIQTLFNSTEIQQYISRARKISKLPLPYRVTYRLFVSLVSSCYNHFALSCDINPSHLNSLKHAVTSILVPKRSLWVCREALYSLTTPGHLLSPHLFLNYRHIIEYLLYVKQSSPTYRNHLSILWHNTLRIKWGPFFHLRNAAKSFAVTIEDPFVFIIQNTAYSIDEPLEHLKHLIRDSYRQHLLYQASLRRYDCQGVSKPSIFPLLVHFTFLKRNPRNKHFFDKYSPVLLITLRGFLNLTWLIVPLALSAMRPDETAKHIFWECSQWSFVRNDYPKLMRFFHLVGTRHETSKVLRSTPQTPPASSFPLPSSSSRLTSPPLVQI